MADEHITEKIEELIIRAENPMEKALLMILNKIATSLDENTKTTQALSDEIKLHRQEFQTHEKKEMALINQGRGFFRAALAALALFQGLTAWYGARVIDEFDRLKEQVGHNSREIEVHKEHHRQEDRYKDAPKVK